MSNLYLDPNGKEITFREWKKRKPAEYKIHEHKTAKTITHLLAADIVVDANLIPEYRHKRYKMESTNILTHDAMGDPYDEPRYVEDEFAAKAFATKEQAVKAYIDFLVEWCGGNRTELESKLSKEVEVTKVPSVEIRAKDMELKALSKPRPVPAVVVKELEDEDEGDDDEGLDEDHPAFKPKVEKKDEPKPAKAPKGSDAPVTTISDELGSW